MTTTRSAKCRKTPTKSFFTMVELIAVITITSILLTITINIMKTDSTKANAQVIGGALAYGQAYAMSKGEYVIIEFTDTDSDSKVDTVTVHKAEDNSGTIQKLSSSSIITEEKLVGGSHPVDSAGTNTTNLYKVYISITGEPIDSSKASDSDGYEFYLKKSTSTTTGTDDTQPVRMKPFTGKVTFY